MKTIQILVSALCLILLAGSGVSQTTGVVEGMALDPSGLVVQQCRVRLVEGATNVTRTAISNDAGRYRAAGPAPGRYDIHAACDGFRPLVHAGLELSAGRTLRVDFHVQLGQVAEEMIVEGSAALLSTSAADWGGTITEDQLRDLPLNGRDVFDLANQHPGANTLTNHDGFISNGLGLQVSVNGNRPNQNSFRMDGVYLNDAASSAPSSAAGRLLGVESIQELRLIANPFNAEYGRAAGAVMTAVSRSGGNDWHGSLYTFLRNNALDAKNFFDSPDDKIPPLRRTQFGGIISGPIRADKAFFLVNYEGVRERSSRTQRAVTLNSDARTGNLPTGQVAVDPSVQPYLEFYPRPNGLDFGDGSAEFISEAANKGNEDFITAKTDFIFSDRLRTSARLSVDAADRNLPDDFLLWLAQDDSLFAFLNSETQYVQSPSTLHSFRVGFSRVRNTEDAIPPDAPAELSFVPGRPFGRIEVTGLTDISPTIVAARPRVHTLQDYQFNYDVSHMRGAHSIRLGAGYDRMFFQQRGDLQAIGRYQFRSINDLLAAQPRRGDLMSAESDTSRHWSQHQYFFFAQDEVRLSRNLNMTLGVRYEGFSTPTERDNKIATLRDPIRDTAMTVGGPLFDNPSATNFAPRAALAWDVFGSGRTVVRAGAGMFFDLLTFREVTLAGMRVPPFFNRLFINNPDFPNLAAAAAATSPDNTLDGLAYNLEQPYVLQFRFAVQQQLDSNTMVEAGYAGSRGIHLIGAITDMNIVPPQILPDGREFFVEGAPKLNPAFGRIGLRATDFNSYYHSLTLRLNRRFSHGVSFDANYAFAKLIDQNSTATVTDFDNSDRTPHPLNLRNQRAPGDFDIRHGFTANASWQAPSPRGGLAKALFGAWELHGLLQLQTGFPFNPRTGFDQTLLQSDFSELDQRPSLASGTASDIVLGDPSRYFNPLAFALPEEGFYGNLGRNILTGPGIFTSNIGVQKPVWSTERQEIRLRAEFFNLTNHPNFSLPSALTLFSGSGERVGSAGRITSTSTTSRQIQMALRWSF